MSQQLPAHGTLIFEALRQTNKHGAEYWSARDLQNMERLELRKQTSEEFKALSGAAQDAGVQSKMFEDRDAKAGVRKMTISIQRRL